MTSLTKDEQARFDPMITGFNPADMYARDHIRRVLQTFPGVFTGIGEFSIHKEFVSAKVSGETASLTNPALDRILDFAAEAGLVAILHSDIDMPFAKTDAEPVYLKQMKALLKRHPKTTIIWAHIGLGRIVHPAGVGRSRRAQSAVTRHRRSDGQRPGADHVSFDISWDEVAKYAVATPRAIARRRRCSTGIPIASCSAPIPSRQPGRRRTSRCSTLGAGLETPHAGGRA